MKRLFAILTACAVLFSFTMTSLAEGSTPPSMPEGMGTPPEDRGTPPEDRGTPPDGMGTPPDGMPGGAPGQMGGSSADLTYTASVEIRIHRQT